jgi:hypothetical protein
MPTRGQCCGVLLLHLLHVRLQWASELIMPVGNFSVISAKPC